MFFTLFLFAVHSSKDFNFALPWLFSLYSWSFSFTGLEIHIVIDNNTRHYPTQEHWYHLESQFPNFQKSLTSTSTVKFASVIGLTSHFFTCLFFQGKGDYIFLDLIPPKLSNWAFLGVIGRLLAPLFVFVGTCTPFCMFMFLN